MNTQRDTGKPPIHERGGGLELVLYVTDKKSSPPQFSLALPQASKPDKNFSFGRDEIHNLRKCQVLHTKEVSRESSPIKKENVFCFVFWR